MSKKKILQDMVIEKRRKQGLDPHKSTIKINKKPKRNKVAKKQKKKNVTSKKKKTIRYSGAKKSSSSAGRIWSVAFLALVFLFFAFSVLFWKASITIYPKIEEFGVNQSMTAFRNSTGDDLSFELVVMTGEEMKMIPTGEVKEYNERATGQVVLYNVYGFEKQRLAIDTRLEGSNGKIYKIKTPTTVPGITSDGLPGTVLVDIYASDIGEEYNSEPIDFKIVGFEGSPKYDGFYGRSKGDISGGASGVKREVSNIDRIAASSELKQNLRSKLYDKVLGQIPEGYVFYEDAVSFSLDKEELHLGNEDEAPLKITGTLYGLLLEEEELSEKIISKSFPEASLEDLYILGLRELSLSMDSDSLFWDTNEISFSLVGNLKAVWRVNESEIQTKVLAKDRSEFMRVLSGFTFIDSADLVIRPFWKKNIPEESNRVNINIKYPSE